MKKKLKILLIILSSITLIWIFKTEVYNTFVSYKIIGKRKPIQLNNPAIVKESKATKEINLDIRMLSKQANFITSELLNFTTEKCLTNPNKFTQNTPTNCIGYSALFTSIINETNDNQQVKSKHLVAKIHFLGVDIHQFFKSSFFKDHDINVIVNYQTDEKYYCDPTLFDFLGIDKIKIAN